MKQIEIKISQLEAFLDENSKFLNKCGQLFTGHIQDEALKLGLENTPAYVILKKNFSDWIGNALDNEATHISILLSPLEAEAKTVEIYIADNGKKYENFPSEGRIDIYENSEGYMWKNSRKKNHLLLSEGQKIEPGNIYLKEIDEKIAYSLITPKGEVVEDIKTEIKAPVDFFITYLNPKKNEIVEAIIKAGHGRICHGGAGMGSIRAARFLYECGGGKAFYVDNQSLNQKVYGTGGVVLLQSPRSYLDMTHFQLVNMCGNIFRTQSRAHDRSKDKAPIKWPTTVSRVYCAFYTTPASSSDSSVSLSDSHSSTSTNSSSSMSVDPQPGSSSSVNPMAFNFSSSSSSSSDSSISSDFSLSNGRH